MNNLTEPMKLAITKIISTTQIVGKYRWKQDVIHHFDPKTGLNVMTDTNGEFISGWKLSDRQINDLKELGNVF